MKNKSYFLYLVVLALLISGRAFADLLDEEESGTVPVATDANSSKDSPEIQPAQKGKTPPQGTTETKTPKSGSLSPPKAEKKDPARAKNGTKKSPQAKLPVHFESKGLKGLREKGLVELVDNVVVTQGDFRLEADKAQVFFDEAAHDVIKVIAEGNVKIFNKDENTGEKLKAFGNQVVFLNKERRVIMEGNARLWRGEDSVIRGKKITYEMDTGWIRADRVAGELAPSEKDKK